MQKPLRTFVLAPAFLCCAMAAHSLAAKPDPAPEAQSRIVFSHALPPLDPAHLQITTVEVIYPPGGASAPHSHPCPVIGYVLKGSVRMQVKGGSETTYRVGDSFYEEANGIHMVSKNASATEAATFLAYFICDHVGPLSVKAPADSSQPAMHP